MPCAHAVAAIAHKNAEPEHHCHAWLTMAAYAKSYGNNHVEPVQGEIYWEHTDQVPPLPPTKKKSAGRPKKQRRKDSSEASCSANSQKVKRKYGEIRCSVCKASGHNKQSCAIAKKQMHDILMAQQAANTATAQDKDTATATATSTTTTATCTATSTATATATVIGTSTATANATATATSNTAIATATSSATVINCSPLPVSPAMDMSDSQKKKQFMPTPRLG